MLLKFECSIEQLYHVDYSASHKVNWCDSILFAAHDIFFSFFIYHTCQGCERLAGRFL